jgi:signal transduction histidine kinase
MTLPDLLCAITWTFVALWLVRRSHPGAVLALMVAITWLLPELLPLTVFWHRAVIAHALLGPPRWWPRTWTARVVLIAEYIAALLIAPWVHPIGAAALGVALVAAFLIEHRERRSRAGITAVTAASAAFALPVILAPASTSEALIGWVYSGLLIVSSLTWAVALRGRVDRADHHQIVDLDAYRPLRATRRELRALDELRAAHRRLQEEIEQGVQDLARARRRLVASALRSAASLTEEIEREVLAPLAQMASRPFVTTTTRARVIEGSARDQLAAAYADIDALIRGLSPPTAERGLAGSLRELGRTLSAHVSTRIDVPPLDDLTARTAYFVCSEALANIEKHAGAGNVAITAVVDEGMLLLVVRDDGRGGADPRGGTGIDNMRDRVESVGGGFELETGDDGTELRVRLPLDPQETSEHTSPGPLDADLSATSRWSGAALPLLGAAAALIWAISACVALSLRVPLAGWSVSQLTAAVIAVTFAIVAILWAPIAYTGLLRVGTATATLAIAAAGTLALTTPGTTRGFMIVSAAFAGLAPTALLHLGLAASAARGQRRRTLEIALLAAAYALGAMLAVTWLAVTDPLRDRECRIPCTIGNAALIASNTASDVIAVLLVVLGLALSVGTVALATHQLLAGVAPPRARPTLALTATVALLQALLYVVPGALPLIGAPSAAMSIPAAHAIASVGLAVSLSLEAESRIRRARLARRVLEGVHSDSAPGAVQRSLASAVHDPDLSVDYWSAAQEMWVDEHGLPAAPRDERPSVTFTWNGAPIARVLSDNAFATIAEVEPQLGHIGRLILDNERQLAERAVQREELRRSSARVVEASDSARRRIERDLHDGAQQRLLVASSLLRQATAAERSIAVGSASFQALDEELWELLNILERLRMIARGLYPPILADVGLVPALESLARSAEVPMVVNAPILPRLDPAVEHTVYLLVRLAAAHTTPGGQITITIERADSRLLVDVAGSHEYGGDGLEDRLVALGAVGTRTQQGERWEFPCES